MMEGTKRVVFSWNLMRYAYGAVLLVVGLDKILGTDFIVYWPKYISPFVASMLPVSTTVFLIAMGVIEIAVGLMLITKWPRIAGYLSVVWLLVIAINLLMLGYVDIAARDVLLAVGAAALAELTVAVEQLKFVKQVA
jgi:hypothetical protein